MYPSDFLTASKKFVHVYEAFCAPVCKKYHLNQSDLDLLLFVANNPAHNTAKDICGIRGIKKAIVSVTTERLVQKGLVTRGMDESDRRIQRLFLTEKCSPVIAAGREMQEKFFSSVTSGLTAEELRMYQMVSEKIRQKIISMEKEL